MNLWLQDREKAIFFRKLPNPSLLILPYQFKKVKTEAKSETNKVNSLKWSASGKHLNKFWSRQENKKTMRNRQ